MATLKDYNNHIRLRKESIVAFDKIDEHIQDFLNQIYKKMCNTWTDTTIERRPIAPDCRLNEDSIQYSVDLYSLRHGKTYLPLKFPIEAVFCKEEEKEDQLKSTFNQIEKDRDLLLDTQKERRIEEGRQNLLRMMRSKSVTVDDLLLIVEEKRASNV